MRTEPPPTADAVLEALAEGFDGLSAQLQRAARFIIDNPREVGVQSMRALAAKAEVGPNTLVRVAQAIGFDGYEAMRECFRTFVVSGRVGAFRDRAEWLRTLAARGGGDAVIGEMAAATADNVERMWRGRSADELDPVIDALLDARRVHVLGMGSASALAHQFWYVARMAFDHFTPIPRTGGHPLDDMAAMGPSDVLMPITFQPYRAETLLATRRAAEQGVTVIAVTDSQTSPLARIAAHALFAPTSTPQFFQSHVAATALLEGLIALMISRAGDDALARIDRFHSQRLEAGLYEEPAALAGLPLRETP